MVTHNVPWLRWSICFSKCGTHLHSPSAYPPDVDGSSAWAPNKLSPLDERVSPISSPEDQHPALTCLPLLVRMWVYDFHVGIYPQSLFIRHEAYWIQDPLVEESTRGHQGTQRATWRLSPGSCHNAMWLPWNLKDFLEDIGWRLAICGSRNSATQKHTPPSKGGRGQSLFSARVLLTLQNPPWPLPFCRVRPGGGFGCGPLAQSLFAVSEWEGSLTHLETGPRTSPSYLVPVPFWLSLLLVAYHPKGSLHVRRTHVVLRAMNNRMKILSWCLL